jgi:hypothetical protein
MSEDKKDHILIPAILTAVAAYFGFKKSSESLGGITKTAVNMALNHQLNKISCSKNKKYLPLKRRKRRRRFK